MITKYNDQYWMRKALKLALRAQNEGEVPVGALLILKNKIISEGWNQSISYYDPTAHAEIIALRHGGKVLNNYRLLHTTLYVTLEPCIMCIGAMIHGRIQNLVYGANNKTSSCNWSINILGKTNINHKIKVTSGVLKTECTNILKNFFYLRRKK
ncbi:tRNA-specific adenosine deaminase [Candidatus Ecksteinia adelgidicola]|nr:tRNA-specific adenosine deaminase [Candidatus Ecksteinia adelgidicola]